MQDIPSGAQRLGRSQTAILAHLLGGGRGTVRECAAAAGLSSPATAHVHLNRLRTLGLIDWQDGREATIHAAVRVA